MQEIFIKIEQKRKEAKDYLPIFLKEIQEVNFEGKIVDINYRIKTIEKINRKVKLRETKEKYQGKTKFEILDGIYDILAFTIVTKNLKEVYKVKEILKQKLLEKGIISDFQEGSDYIQKNSKAGYKGILLYLTNLNGMTFEVQITDQDNLKIREETHDLHDKLKYQ